MRIRRTFNKRPRIEMIPLIDVVFLLLVFFIYSMLSLTVHRGLPVQLPTASTSQVAKHEFISISLQRDGRLFIEDREVDLHSLPRLLMQAKDRYPETKVYLRADKEVSYQKVVEVLNLVRLAGIYKLALETKWEKR